MVRSTRLTRMTPMIALAAIALLLPAQSSAVPTITIQRAEDPSDLNGGPYWLPPGEALTAPAGYCTDRSRHHNDDINIEVRVTSGTQIQGVTLTWLQADNPDGATPTEFGPFPMNPLTPGQGNEIWTINTGPTTPPTFPTPLPD